MTFLIFILININKEVRQPLFWGLSKLGSEVNINFLFVLYLNIKCNMYVCSQHNFLDIQKLLVINNCIIIVGFKANLFDNLSSSQKSLRWIHVFCFVCMFSSSLSFSLPFLLFLSFAYSLSCITHTYLK